MPIYEYACTNEDCKAVSEKMRKVAEADNPYACPQCGQETRRKVSATNFQLKGGGWAADGYGK